MTNLDLIKEVKTAKDLVNFLDKLGALKSLKDDADFWYGLHICDSPKCPYYHTDECPSWLHRNDDDDYDCSCPLDDIETILDIWLKQEI